MSELKIEELLNNYSKHGATIKNIYKNSDLCIDIRIDLADNNLSYDVHTKTINIINVKTLTEAVYIVNNFNNTNLLSKVELYKEVNELYEYGLCDLLNWFNINELMTIHESLKYYIKFDCGDKCIPNQSKILEVLAKYKGGSHEYV